MTYDEKIAQVVEMAFKADLDEDAKVIVNEAIRVATEVNAELDDIWEDYNTMKTKYDYVVGLVGHLEELAKKYKRKALFYYEQAKSTGVVDKLYNAGYRKVADDDEIVESMKTYERAREETAREILKTIETYGNYKSTDYMIEIIKHKYGVELED